MLGNILRGKAEMDQLADDAYPVLVALVFPDAVNRQLVVPHVADTLVVSPTQHFDDVAHPKALVHASDSRERFARVHQTVVLLRRVEADIAVAARRLSPFTKVVEQYQTAASLRFGEGTHRVKLVAFDILQLPLRFLLETAAQPRHIRRIVKQHRFRRQAITPGAAGFLIIGFDIARDIKVHHKAHVGLVDPHPERHRCDHDLQVVALEFFLYVGADVVF